MRAVELFAFILCGVIRGTSPYVLKKLVKYVEESFVVLARSGPTIVLFLISIAIYCFRSPTFYRHLRLNLSGPGPYYRSILMGFNTAIPFICLAVALQYISSGAGSVLMALSPVLALLVSRLPFVKKKSELTKPKIVGSLICLAGVACVVAHSLIDNRTSDTSKIIMGICIFLAGVLAMAILAVIWKQINSAQDVAMWIAAEEYRSIHDVAVRRQRADEILAKYINKMSNLPEYMIETLRARRIENNAPLDLFLDVQDHIIEKGDVHFMVGALGQSVTAAIYAILISIVWPPSGSIKITRDGEHFGTTAWLGTAYFGVFSGYAAVLLIYYLYDRIGAVETQRVLYLVPVVGTIEDAVFEHGFRGQSAAFIVLNIIGVVLVIFGLYVISLADLAELKLLPSKILGCCGLAPSAKTEPSTDELENPILMEKFGDVYEESDHDREHPRSSAESTA